MATTARMEDLAVGQHAPFTPFARRGIWICFDCLKGADGRSFPALVPVEGPEVFGADEFSVAIHETHDVFSGQRFGADGNILWGAAGGCTAVPGDAHA